MSSIVTFKRAVTVVGVSAALFCASAAGYFFYKRRRGRSKQSLKSKSPSKKGQSSPKAVRKIRSASKKNDKVGSHIHSDEENRQDEASDTDYTSDWSDEDGEVLLKRRGRKVRRRPLKAKTKSILSPDRGVSKDEGISLPSSEQVQVGDKPETTALSNEVTASDAATAVTEKQANGETTQQQTNWAERTESSASSEAEITAVRVSSEKAAVLNGPRGQVGADNCVVCSQIQRQQHDPSPAVSSGKSQCADSPSLGSDLHSEASQDSGKGASMGVTSAMSPVEELIEVPPVYEFEVPRDIVGLLIGKKGSTIKWLTEQSQAYIVIREHFYSEKHKICTIEGSREQINKCLRLIRRKFPPSRFPELRLTPVLPPPVSTPKTPVWDNVVQLSLPEEVNCEVAVSSIVNIGHVFLQQPTHPTFPSLTRLDQYMLTVYGQSAGIPPLPRPVEMAVICAAPVLGGWYRAQTIDFYEDTDEALVKFVDYGGYSRVSVSDLRQIRSDFMTLPFQATECYLANIAPLDEAEGWPQEALSLFEQLSLGKVIEAKVTGHSDNTPLVELHSWTQDSKSVMINRLLVDRGYAVWTD